MFAAKRSEAIDGIFCKDLSTNMKEKHSLAVIVCGFAKWNSRKAFFLLFEQEHPRSTMEDCCLISFTEIYCNGRYALEN